jgi:F-type H+-transporting ATPase subunit delta
MDNRIADRYAVALMDIGKEKKSVETFAKDLAVISEALHDVTELRAMLHTPVIRPDVKRKVLHQVFSSHVSPDLLTFMDLLIAKGRSHLLGLVAEGYQRLLDEETGTVTAVITSASPLDETAKQQIIAKLHAIVKLKIRAKYEIDPTLRGGFVAKIGDTFIDASLQHQLENLREEWKSAAPAHLN